jgi:hypothetical protein
MTAKQKIIKNKLGLLNLGKGAWKCLQGLQGIWLFTWGKNGLGLCQRR